MPDQPEKLRPHPSRRRREPAQEGYQPALTPYAELCATSNFTFLRGASHPEELIERAAALGHHALAIADTNSLAGVVRAHVAAKRLGFPLVIGCRLEPQDAPAVCVYPTDRPAYSRLCNLLTLGKRRAPKGECHLTLHDLLDHHEGLLAIIDPPGALDERFIETVRGLRGVFDEDRLSLAAFCAHAGDDAQRLEQLAALSRHTGVPLVATNRALYHDPDRRPLQDVLTCIRHGTTIERAGFLLEASAERHLKAPEEMARLMAACPGAVERSADVARRAAFTLDELRYEYPDEPCPRGLSPDEYLRRECEAGARRRYPKGVPDKTTASLEHELSLIAELRYAPYFLTCYDIVNFARSRGILCQGRGGAANSAVCYCLGLTEVDPARRELLFERFISRERNEPPDIDIDFEHERREEVIQYIYETYGRERAALTAEVVSYRGRSSVREVGKAMGLTPDAIDALAGNLDHWGEAVSDRRVRELGFDADAPTIRHVIRLSRELVGFPRHLSQHVGGFVITRGRLCDLVPIENAAMEDRTVIEWDKDDIDALGMLKIDCLGLGMLTCIRKSFELLEGCGVQGGTRERLTIADVMGDEQDDDGVYEMITHADTIGVFQIESRAQMTMLPRLRPREFYDLVIEVAIVRPGPLQGGMVHPYLRRREGAEPVEYPSPEVRQVLERTLGVPLFQEQAMQLAIVAAGFTPDEADGLRSSMAAWRKRGDAMVRYGRRLVSGMVANGYERAFAVRCFEQLKGFSEYGFPESHAASFAILVYVSAWLKRHHPAAFAAALLNSQPMGFYQPAQIVRDAREHGVDVRAIDVNRSAWDCALEAGESLLDPRAPRDDPSRWGAGGPALRLGMRLVKGLAAAEAGKITEAVRAHGPIRTVESLWRASGVKAGSLRALAKADALGSMGLDRRRALWQVKPLRDAPMPLFEGADSTNDDGLERLPETPPAERVLHDYDAVGLSLRAHPVSFIRDPLERRGVSPAERLRSARSCPHRSAVAVAGIVLCRQRPGTASGVVFITLEDETGVANLVVWRDVFERYRRVARLSTLLLARGTVERAGAVVHVHARSLETLDGQLPSLVSIGRDFR